MRIGAMVVGILLSIWTFLEAMLVAVATASGDSDETYAGGGVLASLFCGVAAVLVLTVPLVSAILFALGALISFAAAAQGYTNHYLYGSIMLLLTVMSVFGWIGKRRERREANIERQRQLERDNRMETLLRQQVQHAEHQVAQPCPACGHSNQPGTRFCGECGTALMGAARP
jgi:uncharacterized membrane protein